MPTIKLKIPVRCGTCGWELESQSFYAIHETEIPWFEAKPCPKCNKEMVRLLRLTKMDHIIKPGEWLLIAVQFPSELPESEACSIDLFFEDFCNTIGGGWTIKRLGKEEEIK